MPNTLTRVAILSLAVLSGGGALSAQTNTPKAAPATISGRVTITTTATTDGDRKGVAGVEIVLGEESSPARMTRTSARARTDAEGRYALSGVAPGHYQILIIAPTFVAPEGNAYSARGRSLEVLAGESIADLNFELERGGIITGRVTNADGKPVIEEFVQITPADTARNPRPFGGPFRFRTDDRGVYRIYGLSAGRYRVSVGQDKDSGMIRMGGQQKFYQRTFHPNATEEAQARIIEVAAGSEATDVDIALGKAARSFKASGRIVSAETGQPVANVPFGYGSLQPGENRIGSYGYSGATSNARGEFQIDALAPGRYAAFVVSEKGAEGYSNAVSFEIDEADIEGLQLKTHHGATLSGVVQIEGANDPATRARLLSQLSLMAAIESQSELAAPSFTQSKPAPDGTFLIKGLRPGKARIYLGWPPVKGLTLLRLERGETDQTREGIEIAEGAQQTAGVRVVLAYGNALIRGQVNVVGGVLPAGGRMTAFATRMGTGGTVVTGLYVGGATGRGEVDARGRFRLDGLAAGDYEVIVNAYSLNGAANRARMVKQTVTVAEGSETNITLTLDLSEPEKGANP